MSIPAHPLGPLFAAPPAPPAPPAPVGGMTLREARALVRDGAKDGVECPCCDRLVKEYTYSVSRTQALFLVALATRARATTGSYGGWVDVRTVGGDFGKGVSLGGKYAKLRWWGVAEAHPSESATWRVTDTGLAWMRGTLTLPKYVVLLDNELQGISDRHATFAEALRTTFDLDETFRGRYEATRS